MTVYVKCVVQFNMHKTLLKLCYLYRETYVQLDMKCMRKVKNLTDFCKCQTNKAQCDIFTKK